MPMVNLSSVKIWQIRSCDSSKLALKQNEYLIISC